MANRLGLGALLILPVGLIAYMSFKAGGFFPRAPAIGAIVTVQFLVIYATAARNPFDGITWPAVAGIASIALLALWILISRAWSHQRAASLIEFDRALFYTLLVLLFVFVGGSAERLRWAVRAIALTIGVIGTIALITRALPHVWPTASSIADNRLSYPLTYWNALGIFCAMGSILCFHLTSSRSEPPWVRVPAAGFIPILATAQYFTFSRGALAAVTIGLIAYVTIARPRSLLSGALAVLPATAAALVVAYHADLLATLAPTTARAVVQGRHVALAVGLAVLAALALRTLLVFVLDRRAPLTAGFKAPVHKAIEFAPLGAAVLVLLVLLVNGTIHRDYNTLVHGSAAPTATKDLRARLFNPANNGRADHYRAAVDGFRTARLHGTGAGTYPITWDRYRTLNFRVVNAHSLYLENLSELGIVGLALIVTFVLTLLITPLRRIRGPNRTLYAAVFAVVLAWALHAGIDWDWQMPAVTIVPIVLGAMSLGNRGRPLQLREPGPNTRLAMGLAAMACLAAPVFVAAAQAKLDAGLSDFRHHQCAQATPELESSLNWVGVRPQAFQALGFCAMREGYTAEAIDGLVHAENLDPKDWQMSISLALARAAQGQDPRPLIGEAIRRNPLEPVLRQIGRMMRSHDPNVWRAQADPALTALVDSGQIDISL